MSIAIPQRSMCKHFVAQNDGIVSAHAACLKVLHNVKKEA